MSKINGIDIREAFEKFQKPCAYPSKEKGGKKYFPIEYYRERLDAVFGANYNIICTSLGNTLLSTGQEGFSVLCRLEILDDEGNVVRVMQRHGFSSLETGKESSRYPFLKNSVFGAEEDALKNCCKAMNIFNNHSLKNHISDDSKKQSQSQPKEQREYVFRTLAPFETVRTDANGKPIFKVKVSPTLAEKVLPNSYLVLYPREYGQVAVDAFNALVSNGSNKTVIITAKCTVSSTGDYILKSLEV